VELFEQIRRDWRAGEVSIRELAVRHHVHRRTVRQALASAVPPPRKAYPQRPRPALDPFTQVIDEWLLADRVVPRKQRHTARRVWQRLVAEHGATVAEVTVSRYVARRRAELGLDNTEAMVPQSHEPGAEAEVDFGEFHAVIAGALAKLWMFVMRLSCSGRAFHVAFATHAQEAFLEGHVLAFEYFGAVPGRVRYDNLGPAVVRVLRGRDRAESERFIALRSHYRFDSFFCARARAAPAAADILDDGRGSPSRSMSRSIRWTRTSRPAAKKTKDGGMVVAVTVMATINSSTILATPGANGVSAVTRSIRRFASPRVPGSGATRSSRRHGPISARTTATCEDTGPSPAAAARI
jgi:transposase